MAERQASTWDITVIHPLAQSYVLSAARSAGAAAELAAARKSTKYMELSWTHIFQPIALESLGPMTPSALDFVAEVGRRISHLSGEEHETAFLFQRIAVAIQRFNSVLLHDNLLVHDEPDLWSFQFLVLAIVLNPRDFYYRGYKKYIYIYNNNNNNNNMDNFYSAVQ
jgi:hypothetical protein